MKAANALDDIGRRIEAFAADNFHAPLRDCAAVISIAVEENFNRSSTPEGSAWPPRKIIGDGHPLLVDTGDLFFAAVEHNASGHVENYGEKELQYGVDGSVIEYAATHNYGRENIPQREFLGLGEPYLAECENALAEYALKTYLK